MTVIRFHHRPHKRATDAFVVHPKTHVSVAGHVVASPVAHRGPTPPEHTVVSRQRFSIFSGAKFQCVEYARRFLTMHHCITFPSIPMAYHILTAMPSFSGIAFEAKAGDQTPVEWARHFKPMDTVKCVNGTLPRETQEALCSRIPHCPHPPVVGSLIIWAPEGYFKHTGHVAAVVGVDEGTGTIHIAEQNVTDRRWPNGLSHARSFRLQTGTRPSPDHRGNVVVTYGLNEVFVDGVIWGWVTPAGLLPSL